MGKKSIETSLKTLVSFSSQSFFHPFVFKCLCGFEKDQVNLHDLHGTGRWETLSFALVHQGKKIGFKDQIMYFCVLFLSIRDSLKVE